MSSNTQNIEDLYKAVFWGNVHTVQPYMPKDKLIKFQRKKGRKRRNVHGDTPLTYAANMGYYNIVSQLLQAGVNIEATNFHGLNALDCASTSGHLNVVKHLLQAGAQVNRVSELNETPLLIATRHGHVAIVHELIKAGASQKLNKEAIFLACTQGCLNMVTCLIDGHFSFDSPDNMGWTPLFFAAKFNAIHIVHYLIHAGASINTKSILGNTALHHAAATLRTNVVIALLDSSYPIEFSTNGNGYTPLHSVLLGHV